MVVNKGMAKKTKASWSVPIKQTSKQLQCNQCACVGVGALCGFHFPLYFSFLNS